MSAGDGGGGKHIWQIIDAKKLQGWVGGQTSWADATGSEDSG